MFEVYDRAACVLIWLGPASTDSDLAMKTLNSLGTVDGEMFVEDMYEGQHHGKKLWILPRDPSKLRNASTISILERTALENFFRYQWCTAMDPRSCTRRSCLSSMWLSRTGLGCSLQLFRLNGTAAEAFRGCSWLYNPLVLD
jgi:hypothetical protein